MLAQMSVYTDNARLGRSKVLRVLEIEQHALDERLIEAPHTGVRFWHDHRTAVLSLKKADMCVDTVTG